MIKVANLQFGYEANKRILHDLNFEVSKGEIFGFLGPNGSGKSTTQKIMMGIISNYQGEVVINNKSLKNISRNFYEDVGVLFEKPYLYNTLSAIDNLKYFASFYKTSKTRNIVELLNLVKLKPDYQHKQVKHYSKGMKQRTSMARCLVNNPKILFLDEPVSGLDPKGAVLFKNIIRAEKEKGTTVFVTTHNMFVADEICDRVAFIVDGKIKVIDSPQRLKQSFVDNKVVVKYIYQGKKHEIEVLTKEIQSGFNFNFDKIISITTKQDTLEDVFIKITGQRLSNE